MRRVILAFLLSACAAAPSFEPSEVAQVILYQDTLNVIMADGSLCVADRPGQAQSWSGQTLGCPYTLTVEVLRPATAPRNVLGPGGDQVIVDGQGWG